MTLGHKEIQHTDGDYQNHPQSGANVQKGLGLFPVLGRSVGNGHAHNHQEGQGNQGKKRDLKEDGHNFRLSLGVSNTAGKACNAATPIIEATMIKRDLTELDLIKPDL